MFTELQIQNFRGFRDIHFEGLNKLNLMTGKNNVGKSSVLEAIYLLCAHTAPQAIGSLQLFRGILGYMLDTYGWTLLFNQQDGESPVVISGKYAESEFELSFVKDRTFIPGPQDLGNLSREFARQYIEFAQREFSLKFDYHCGEYSEKGYLFLDGKGSVTEKVTTSQAENQIKKMPGVIYINQNIVTNSGEALNWLGALLKQDKVQELVQMAQIIEPGLTEIFSVPAAGATLIHGRINGKILPLKLAGSGLNQIFYLLMAVVANPGTIVLLDEIENGFHYSVYKELWKLLAVLAEKYGNQFFVTTHSYECLQGANGGVKEACAGNVLSYYRLDKFNDENHAHRLDYEEFEFALQHEMEIR